MDENKLLNKRYEIKEILGRGGFATTYLAVDTETQQKCAIKCLLFRKIEEWKTWELFEREAKILKGLNHPQIPKYIDFFSIETEEDIELYLVQEYVEGKSLAQLVREGKHFSEHEVIEIGLEITNILNYLHSFSPPIIHRDIKPSNIILTQSPSSEESGVGLVYLIDFGAVREKMISDYSTVGGGSTIVGTYGYMPIEQFEGRALPASDIFSLGITLIALLSRKEPIEIEKKGISLNYRPHVDISGSFIAVLDKMTVREYKKRYQTALQVKKDLEKLQVGRRVFNIRILVKTFIPVAVVMAILIGWFASSLFTRPTQPPHTETIIAPSPQLDKNVADIHRLEKLIQASRIRFLAHDGLGALFESVKLGKSAKYESIPKRLRNQIILHLREIVYGIRERNRLEGHKKAVNSVDMSPDGTILASGSWDKTIKLWKVNDGSLITTFHGHSNGVKSVDFSSDGRLLASESSWLINLWDVKSRNNIGTLKHFWGKRHSDITSNVNFNPANTLLASGSMNSTLRLWNVMDGKIIKELQGRRAIFSVHFSSDGKQLVASENTMIKLWNVTDGHEIATLQGHFDPVYSVDFSSDDKMLVSGSGDKTIKLWNVIDGEEINTLQGHLASVRSVKFSPNNTLLASGSDDTTIKVWNVENGNEVATLQGHSQGVRSLDFTPDGKRLASGSLDGTIRLWDIENDNKTTTLNENSSRAPQPLSYTEWNVDFSPDDKILASESAYAKIKFWNVENGHELRTLQTTSIGVNVSVSFSPNGMMLASGTTSGMLKLWDVMNGVEIAPLNPGRSRIIIKFSPDGTILASAGKDSDTHDQIELWNVKSRSQIMSLQGHSKRIKTIDFSPDGTILASGSEDNTIKLWSMTDGAEIITLYGHSDTIYSVDFSPDGTKLVSGSEDKTIKLWDITTGNEIMTLKGHSSSVYSVMFSPDGAMLASGSGDKTVRFWDVESGEQLSTVSEHSSSIYCVKFSSDGKMLASGDQNQIIKLWNLDLDNLLVRGCEWLHGYLKNNPNVSEEDRGICDDILNNT